MLAKNLPQKRRQELEILMRTRSLLFSKLEKLLDQQIGDVDQMNTATSQSIDTGKIEELSTYIDRVEQ